MTNTHAAPATKDTDFSDEELIEEFKPLTAQAAQAWRQRNPSVSPWWVVGMQALVACGLVLLSWALFGAVVATSVAYGALAVVLPASVLVRGLRRQRLQKDAGAAFLGFVVWEVVKVVLTVVMLLLAPRFLSAPNWLALVAGFVATMKVYWVAAWWQSRRQTPA